MKVKIHIVQQGDSMWDLSQKYGVDFDKLLKANQHIANPDVMMPGMKVKIPSGAIKPKKELVKKELPKKKEEIKVKVEQDNAVEISDIIAPDKKDKKALPKKELPKKEAPKKLDLPKIDGTKVDQGKVKQLLKEISPEVLKDLLDEVKPQFLEDFCVKPEHTPPPVVSPTLPAPPPTAPYEYKPEKTIIPIPKKEAPKKHGPATPMPYVAQPYAHAPYTPTPCHPCAPQYPGNHPSVHPQHGYQQASQAPHGMQPYGQGQNLYSPWAQQEGYAPYATGQPSHTSPYAQPGINSYGGQQFLAQQPAHSHGYPTSYEQANNTSSRAKSEQKEEK